MIGLDWIWFDLNLMMPCFFQSIISLAWCFSYYHATLKRGALDRDLAALFYRCVLFLSNLFQILGRLFILVLYSYAWGPYKGYYPMLIFLGCHIVLMSILHFIFR